MSAADYSADFYDFGGATYLNKQGRCYVAWPAGYSPPAPPKPFKPGQILRAIKQVMAPSPAQAAS